MQILFTLDLDYISKVFHFDLTLGKLKWLWETGSWIICTFLQWIEKVDHEWLKKLIRRRNCALIGLIFDYPDVTRAKPCFSAETTSRDRFSKLSYTFYILRWNYKEK